MKRNRRVQIIYGDGSSESYLTDDTYNTAWEQARKEAIKRGTSVRSFAYVKS